MGLLIKNASIFTNSEKDCLLHNHAIAIERSRIKEIGLEENLVQKYSEYDIIDGRGRLLLPGWINAHMHCYSTYARGLALHQSPNNFIEILEQLWWKLDKSLDEESTYYSALIPAIAAVKSGVTAIIDHHASPMAIDGSLDRIENALRQVGLRAILCYEVSDRDGPERRKQGLDENERFIMKCRTDQDRRDNFLFEGIFGLHASLTLNDETLESVSDLNKKFQSGFHLHVAESETDNDPKYKGTRAVERLKKFDILGNKTIAAHGIHLTEEEMNILAETDTMVVHNPQSNMNNAVGRTNIFQLLNKSILVGLGSDGMSASLYPEMRAANLIHKHDLKNPAVGWNETRQMVLRNNSAIYERITGQKLGVLKPGYLADMILVDYFPPTPLTCENIWGHILFGIADAPVDTTIINGSIVMRNKEFINLDEAEIAAKSREFASKVWDRF
jgi:putative selenium metabolism protein SsnA